MEYVEKLANLIMIQYYLAADLDIHDADFSVEEAEIGQKALDECGGHDLSSALDNYIKEHDWTGYLGTVGSGNRERHFAVEGFFEANNSNLKYSELDESTLKEEKSYHWLAYNEDKRSFEILENCPKNCDSFCFWNDHLYKIEELLPKLNSIANKDVTFWDVTEDNPFGGRTHHNIFYSEYEADEYYDELCDSQGGRSSYDDDEGGMDYAIDAIEKPFKDMLPEFEAYLDDDDFIEFVNSIDLEEPTLKERAMEIGNGKVYAVQDAFYTRKTHDATGDRDIWIKNGDKDPNLTSTEKDIARKSIEVLKQMGKLGDISKEYNVDHGPDLTYIPVEDVVKVTPDNGSQPYKIKIPEALSFLKSYEYDILDEAVAVYTKVDECKKALQESFSAIETVSPADNKSFGYLENEVTIFKIK